MDAVLLTKIELCQRLSHPVGISRNSEFGNVDIAVEQLTLVERTFLAMHLSLDIARTQILYKQAFEGDGAMLGRARKHREHNDQDADGNHQGWRKAAEEVADIEDKSHRYEHTHHDGKRQRNTIAITLGPQRLPLLAVVLLHHHGAQERCNEEDGEQTSDGVGIPMELPTRQ